MDTLQEKLAYWRDGGMQIAKGAGVKNGRVRTPVFDDRPGKEGRVAGWHTHHFQNGEIVRTDATATPETIRTGMVTHG